MPFDRSAGVSPINGIKTFVFIKEYSSNRCSQGRAGAEEKGYGIPPLNYALGWYTLDIDNKEVLLRHPGGNAGFIAQVVVDSERKNAVQLAINVRASHNHLFKAINRIKAHYSKIADLPGIE